MDTSIPGSHAGHERDGSRIMAFSEPHSDTDMSIQVFNQQFHVHSAPLKLRSAFFRAFLDSPDKVPSIGGRFKYMWVTEVDEDGTWQLICSSPDSKSSEHEFVGNAEDEIRSFTLLLHALHGHKFDVLAIEDLDRAVILADYYCALPALSSHLNINTPVFTKATFEEPHKLIESAFQPRHSTLYRECLIQCMGPWGRPKYLNIENEPLRELAAESYKKLEHTVLDTEEALIDTERILTSTRYRTERSGPTIGRFKDVKRAAVSGCGRFTAGRYEYALPLFYQQLMQLPGKQIAQCFRDSIEPLLKNHLVMDSGAQAGLGKYRNHFLCLDIKDNDLPWTIGEAD
ncbi:hypothetical protein LSUE1_G004184, partial [Lachnellula suecica]